ncbi:MAG: hypothetical protein JWL82_390 [Parcubacteria group bacterium]|nr:hypothetical protein [Parcubacteria group bacterium]
MPVRKKRKLKIKVYKDYEDALLLALVLRFHKQQDIPDERFQELAREADDHSSDIQPSSWNKRIMMTVEYLEHIDLMEKFEDTTKVWWDPLMSHVGRYRTVRDRRSGVTYNVADCLRSYAKKRLGRLPKRAGKPKPKERAP